MKLVEAKCTNCGGALRVDSERDAAICPYCNSAFVVEKAINLYNATVINGNQVNNYYVSSSDDDIQREFKKAEGYVQIGLGNNAIHTLVRLAYDHPGDYVVRKRLLDYSFAYVETWKDHEKYSSSVSGFDLAGILENARKCCPADERNQLENEINEFFNRVYYRIINGDLYVSRLLGVDNKTQSFDGGEFSGSCDVSKLSGLHKNIDYLLYEGKKIAEQLKKMGISFDGKSFRFLKNMGAKNELIWLIGKEVFCYYPGEPYNEINKSYVEKTDIVAKDDKEFYKQAKYIAKRNKK